MKTVRILAVLIAIFAVAGCGEKVTVVEKNKLLDRGGLLYEGNSETPFTGKTVNYWPNGQKEEEVEYRNGKLHGKFTSWYESGQKEGEHEYRNGKLHGKLTLWYENGTEKFEGEYRNGKRHGKLTLWYENGTEKFEGEYRNGKRR